MSRTFVLSVVAVVATAGLAAYIYWPQQHEVPTGAPSIEPVASPEPAVAAPATAPAPVPSARQEPSRAVTEPAVAEAVDDGDRHGQERRETLPLETPPPSGERFGADPAGETAALGDARAMLEALQGESDPETKAQIAKLLQSIDAAP